MEQRIQKILALMGIASRRKAEEYIAEGRVTVNGKVATLGMKADPERDHIKVDGKLLVRPEPKVYYMLNKPREVVTSLSDPSGRTTVKAFLKGIRYRVFPVGRLDYDSEGLLLITNDGDFAQSLLHPSKEVPKVYQVKVKGTVGQEKIEKLRHGVRLEDGMTAPARVKRISMQKAAESNSWLEVAIHEGRKRQVRRMLEKVGHPVIKLKRVGIDGLRLGDLKPGEIRPLTREEVERIRQETGSGE
ncbi:MAG: rRNA pseudouridine synthase [Alphaproteobacteria bacterium]|uniref:Pseudouridine synthase n=1 Tax=Candidatus Nitrobium versatile TaxID=2884831 RepID=A0A953J6M9_9BACT|nr:rRNA pseudouridine synthase [Candidatus Nitrobium versatile]